MLCDNLYLNWPAGGDDREKQSFFWFHDHRMDHTGSNVYKGMVGLYPIYDPKNGMDMGDETQGLRLPGVRTNHADGSFDVDYDIPLAFYDCRLDDGVTIHKDIHDTQGEFPAAEQPRDPPGMVGQDLLQALPEPRLRRRHLHRQRHRLPDAGGEAAQVPLPLPGRVDLPDLRVQADELDQGPEVGACRWATPATNSRVSTGSRTASSACSSPRSPPTAGCCRSRSPGTRSSCGRPSGASSSSTSPSTRTGSPTTKGDVIYLTNVMKMPDGRMWSNSSRFIPDPNYKMPMVKFVIGDDAAGRQRDAGARRQLRDLPPLPANWQTMLDDRLIFEVQRGSRRRRDRVAHQRQAVRPDGRATSLKNKAGQDVQWPRRRRTPSTSGRSATAAAAGCTPSTCTWRSTGPSCGTTRTSP